MTAQSPTSAYSFVHDSSDAVVYNSDTTVNTDYWSIGNSNCPLTCTWTCTNNAGVFPTNDMPNRNLQSTATDLTLSNPTGGFTYVKTNPFYISCLIKCSNQFQEESTTITVAITCMTTSTVLTDPTVFKNATAFLTTQQYTIVPSTIPAFVFPQTLYNVEGHDCEQYYVLNGDSGCEVFPGTAANSPTNGKMKCLPVAYYPTSSYYIQTYTNLQYTETLHDSRYNDYTFNIKTSALGFTTSTTRLVSP